MNKTFYHALEEALKTNDKDKAVQLTLNAYHEGLEPVTFYEDVITPILNNIYCQEDDYACIWLEHQMSAIVRTLIEMSYAYVIKSKETLNEKKHVLIVCPKDEYHELGAVIGSHLFKKTGFKTTYVGANTPLKTIDSALRALTVDYLVLSVSNAYHLSETKKVINHVSDHFASVKVLGAGRGFQANTDIFDDKIYSVISNYASLRAFKQSEGL